MNCFFSVQSAPLCCEDSFLISLDRICDFVSIASTVTNLIDLFQKQICNFCEISVRQNSYWSYIENKDNLRCILLAIPFFNIPVAIYYYFTSSPFEIQTDLQEEESMSEEQIEIQLSGIENYFNLIPDEIISVIFSFADSQSFRNQCEVCLLWKRLSINLLSGAYRAKVFGNKQWAEIGGHEIVKNEDMDEEAESLSLFINDIINRGFKKSLHMLDLRGLSVKNSKRF